MSEGLTYRGAGVDIGAGEDAVARITAHVATTHRPEVLSEIGAFGGLFAGGFPGLERPVLVASTDGVGTKSKIAQLTGRYDTIGIDLVAMNVDDLAVQGAEPLFFLDYISVGSLDPDTMDHLVAGVAEGCRQAGCALLGGEMSEHPDLMTPGDFDLVGFAVGVVDHDDLLPAGVSAGDQLIGVASPGLRCNGYSLARRALLDRAVRSLDEPAWPGAESTLGEELLRPSTIYSPALRELRAAVEVHAFAHVTGGGLADNLARVLPEHVGARIERGSWTEPRIFSVVQQAGGIDDDEMAAVFNLGVGMIVVVPAASSVDALARLSEVGHDAWLIGDLVDGDGGVDLVT